MKLLASFTKIGIDFDGTLIGHRNSKLLWNLISENPFGQDFHIVTFRSGGLERDVWLDLSLAGSPLTESHFAALHSCPHRLWQDFHFGGSGRAYLHWKGEVCAANKIEVLIDDMTSMVEQGCRKNGIKHFHPDQIGE